MPAERIVVIGAGQAGASLVAALRAGGHDGPITLIGSEPAPPYQRPPLSKKYLLGEMAVERLYLRPLHFYHEADITLRLSTSATAIDRERQIVLLSDGTEIGYDRLVLTTGSTPVTLPSDIGGALKHVYQMRTLKDADTLAPVMQPGARALVVGGGYIGLEAAAVFASRGLKVTLLEQAERILSRVAAAQTSDYFRRLHQEHGVDIREATGLRQLEGSENVESAILSDGAILPVDFALVGVGIRPDTALAEAAGLSVENGICVDECGRTSDRAIFAAGDCASFPHQGRRIRLESVPHAIEQAEAVARAILGDKAVYQAKPWFWSDQYDVKLQIAGLNTGYDMVVVRPGARPGSQSVWYFKEKQLLAVDAMNAPREYMMAKRLIESGRSIPPQLAADPESDLKALL